MRPDLEQRIKEVHPNGKHGDFLKERFLGKEYDSMIVEFINYAHEELNVKCICDLDWDGHRIHHFFVTLDREPDFNKWIEEFDNKKKLHWIYDSGTNYAVLHLNFSRVWPCL